MVLGIASRRARAQAVHRCALVAQRPLPASAREDLERSHVDTSWKTTQELLVGSRLQLVGGLSLDVAAGDPAGVPRV